MDQVMNIQNGDRKDKTQLKVLFVEDYEVDVELAVLELERDGFAVMWTRVEEEKDLRNYLVSNTPDIVLSDYSMPHFDGLSALRIVKEIAPDLPFIFVSGTIGEERAIESIKNGATDYVLKGNIRRLGTSIRRTLAEKRDQVLAKIAEEERSRLAAILEATSDFVTIYNPNGKLIYANNALCKLYGVTGLNISDMDMYALYPQWSRNIIQDEGITTAVEKGHWHGEVALLTGNRDEIPVSKVIIAHKNKENKLQYISTIARDIRERKEYEARITHLANYDALTNLPNRILLSDRVSQATTYGWRADRSIALLVVDIDRFKLVNDGFGQAVGDKLLKMVADRLYDTLREGDTVARLGADAFAVLATNLANSDDVLIVARKIQESLRKPITIDVHDIHITVSIGASIYPRDGSDFESLLRNSDAAMHRAKSQGQNGFQFFASEMTQVATERVELENSLRMALSRNELSLHYQPQLEISTGKIIGVEALMRWKHPQRGYISPGQFIPVAENSDLIFELGNWALITACRQMYDWGKKAENQKVAVNVSANQFLSSDFIEIVSRVLHKSGLEPSRLELEITEGVLVEDKEMALKILEQLKEIGVKIAIDDFGTGYSSLSYLSHLPIDCLKIDKSFVQSSSSDPRDTAIIRTIISLGNSLDLTVLAEGIETEEQLTFLHLLGCREGQGYLFSRPIPADTMDSVFTTGLEYKYINNAD